MHLDFFPHFIQQGNSNWQTKGKMKCTSQQQNKAAVFLPGVCEVLHKTCFPSAPVTNDHKLALAE